MSKTIAFVDNDLSKAWASVFLTMMKKGNTELSPLVVSVTGFCNGRPNETQSIRNALERELSSRNLAGIRTVSNTIFPESLWNPQSPRSLFFERYHKILPRIKKCKKNRYGVYFERLISYNENKMNQLEYIITTYKKGNHRRSALQVTIIDPLRDSTNQKQRGFPCLQQVSFCPIGKDGLVVSGYYPHQYQFERAYGNYLGLCLLGNFVAHELELNIVRMNCFVNIASLEVKKTDIVEFREVVEGLLEEAK